MPLIKCPECGNAISDKSKICIHCGFPIAEQAQSMSDKSYICIIDNRPFDLTKYKEIIDSADKSVLTYMVDELANDLFHDVKIISIYAAKEIIQTIISTNQVPSTFDVNYGRSKPRPIATLRCPKCGSTAVTTSARGVNFTLGLIGASRTVNRCGNCGYTFKPKR